MLGFFKEMERILNRLGIKLTDLCKQTVSRFLYKSIS